MKPWNLLIHLSTLLCIVNFMMKFCFFQVKHNSIQAENSMIYEDEPGIFARIQKYAEDVRMAETQTGRNSGTVLLNIPYLFLLRLIRCRSMSKFCTQHYSFKKFSTNSKYSRIEKLKKCKRWKNMCLQLNSNHLKVRVIN